MEMFEMDTILENCDLGFSFSEVCFLLSQPELAATSVPAQICAITTITFAT